MIDKQIEKQAPWRKKRLDMERYLPEKKDIMSHGKKIFRKQNRVLRNFFKKMISEIKNSIKGL